MIYLEPSALTWRPLLASYLNSEFYPALKEFEKEFETFFCFLAYACLAHVRHESKVSSNNHFCSSRDHLIIAFKHFIGDLISTALNTYKRKNSKKAIVLVIRFF